MYLNPWKVRRFNSQRILTPGSKYFQKFPLVSEQQKHRFSHIRNTHHVPTIQVYLTLYSPTMKITTEFDLLSIHGRSTSDRKAAVVIVLAGSAVIVLFPWKRNFP